MAIIDRILSLSQPREEEKEQSLPQPPQNSWVKDLIDQRYQPKTERLKRAPVGFQFKRDPFDPSSYYKDIGTLRDISKLATGVTETEVSNRRQAEMQRQFDENQAAINGAMGGVNAKFTYDSNGVSRKYGLKGISSNASHAADFWGSKYGIKTIGGKGPGSVPGSDHPKGRALDFMINNVSNGKARGTALANDLIKNYKSWNIKYVIWNRYIWHPGRGWTKYSGPSPHTDHVHVSFNK